MEFNLFYID
jgi:Lipoprotein amino terminal region